MNTFQIEYTHGGIRDSELTQDFQAEDEAKAAMQFTKWVEDDRKEGINVEIVSIIQIKKFEIHTKEIVHKVYVVEAESMFSIEEAEKMMDGGDSELVQEDVDEYEIMEIKEVKFDK